MPPYKVILSSKAERQFFKLPENVADSIEEKMKKLSENPRPVGSKKLKGAKDTWRVRAGNYRIVYDIQDAILVVTVIKLGHRREIYD
jgi:mRNA interferase RelE/StbE